MRVPLSWLAEHVDVDVPVAALADMRTLSDNDVRWLTSI